MAKAGRADATVRQVHCILRGAIAYAVEREWIDRNVAAIRRPPRQGATVVVAPTLDELRKLLAEAGDPGCDLWTCIALAATLGARAGELCALRWSDVDIEAGTVTIARSVYADGGGAHEKSTKSGKVRVVAIDRLTSDVLETRRAWQLERWERVHGGTHPTELVDDAFVLSFWSDGSGPPGPGGYSSAFGKLRNRLGLKHLHLHSLRHWSATHALDAGVPLAVVSERLGHSSPAVTARIYTHAVAGRDREAAEILGRVLAP